MTLYNGRTAPKIEGGDIDDPPPPAVFCEVANERERTRTYNLASLF